MIRTPASVASFVPPATVEISVTESQAASESAPIITCRKVPPATVDLTCGESPSTLSDESDVTTLSASMVSAAY